MKFLTRRALSIKRKLNSFKINYRCVNTLLIISENEPLMFETDKTLVPTLRLLHKFPSLLPKMQIDKGGIKFIINGANVMSPGLTSAGGKMDEVDANVVGNIQ